MREWRLARGMRQEDLANAIGTVKSLISRYETGETGMTFDLQLRVMTIRGGCGSGNSSLNVKNLTALRNRSRSPVDNFFLTRVVGFAPYGACGAPLSKTLPSFQKTRTLRPVLPLGRPS